MLEKHAWSFYALGWGEGRVEGRMAVWKEHYSCLLADNNVTVLELSGAQEHTILLFSLQCQFTQKTIYSKSRVTEIILQKSRLISPENCTKIVTNILCVHVLYGQKMNVTWQLMEIIQLSALGLGIALWIRLGFRHRSYRCRVIVAEITDIRSP